MRSSCRLVLLALALLATPLPASAQDTIELETTIIKGNKELPKILYIVPWKEVKAPSTPPRKLVLHSLFGDLFDPVVPDPYQ